MKERKNRDQIVLATKYTIGYKNAENDVTLKVCLQNLKRIYAPTPPEVRI